MVTYTESLGGITADMLEGFFTGWGAPPSNDTRLRMLRGNDHVILAAAENEKGRSLAGFINAITDGSHFAFIPLLEVLPDYQNQGIGTELVRRMLDVLHDYPCIDLTCDPQLQSFYRRCGMQHSVGMVVRNYSRHGPTAT